MRGATAIWLGISLATALVLAPAAARADEVHATDELDVVEADHFIEVILDRGHARLIARRVVQNRGPLMAQAVFGIDLPDAAAARGLRLRVDEGDGPRWRDALLVATADAVPRYEGLGDERVVPSGAAAILSWVTMGQLELQMFPVAPHRTAQVEYTLDVATSYSEGRDHLSLPAMGTAELPAVAAVRPARAGDSVFVDGKPVRPGARISLDAETRELSVEADSPAPIDGTLAVVPFAEERTLVYQRIAAAKRISRAPKGAHVVVAIDVSRSLRPAEVAGAVAATRAYLSHLPGARVQVLTFDRAVRLPDGGFVRASAALSSLGDEPLARKNGSRIDLALERAASLLSGVDRRVARRILVLTDLRTRESLRPESVRDAVARSGALVHVGVIRAGGPSLARDDDDPWAAAVRPSGGLVWNAAATAEPERMTEMRAVYEEWARPLRFDHLRVKGPGVVENQPYYPEQLAEGEGLEDTQVAERGVGWLEITGETWATPFKRIIQPDEAEGHLRAALATSGELSLNDKETAVLARHGHAVSSVTSFVTAERGQRPLERGEHNSFGSGTGTSGRGGSFGHGAGSSRKSTFDAAAFLRERLRHSLATCGAADRRAELTIETTLDEIVDVAGVTIAGARGRDLARCLEEAAWELELGPRFDVGHATYRIEL